MDNKYKSLIAALTLSASAFIGIVMHENYTENAIIPTKNDRPTMGYGSTFHEDGTPVKMGEKTTPVKALVMARIHISKDEKVFQDSLPNVRLSQTEYDVYMNWIYQYGSAAWMTSSMRKNLLKGEYTKACNSMLLYKYSGGYDCSIPNNKICSGVWERQKNRNTLCLSVQ